MDDSLIVSIDKTHTLPKTSGCGCNYKITNNLSSIIITFLRFIFAKGLKEAENLS
jgi:hypothetical protein